ncbi:hypothetical protein [Pelagibius marinus]|uniref:hypothetical protein n=1 Tax=Pelagibius marinus TaxID=2762760 RepID=UPI00187234A4|nr:hypothetical protein [Pelagibius marinus]
MSEFADQLIALNVPRSSLEFMGLVAWVIGAASFCVLAVLWVLLPFNMAPEAKKTG